MTEGKLILLDLPVKWRYSTPTHVGQCSLDGKELTVRLTLRADGLDRVPDVLQIEAWLKDWLRRTPCTVEEVAVAAAKHWAMTASAEGESRSHGTIGATYEGEG